MMWQKLAMRSTVLYKSSPGQLTPHTLTTQVETQPNPNTSQVHEMQAESEKVDGKNTAEVEISACHGPDGTKLNACGAGSPPVADPKVSGQGIPVKSSATRASDEFYEKFTKFYDSSGLSLVFNFRETKLDLYLFYKDVIERGGYCQVSKYDKWGQVASALKAAIGVPIPPAQLQMLYANLFYQFEQKYYYRSPEKAPVAQMFQFAPTGHSSGSGNGSSSPIRNPKRNNNGGDDKVEKRICLKSSFHYPTEAKTDGKLLLQGPTEEKNLIPRTPSKGKETKKSSTVTEEKSLIPITPSKGKETKKSSITKELKKHPNAPRGYRTGYVIFLAIECERLKKIHGEGLAGQIRNMAIQAWKGLSKTDREPYNEASRRDKERYNREMAVFEEMYLKNKEPLNVSTSIESTKSIDIATSSRSKADYNAITLPPDAYHVGLPSNVDANFVANQDLAAGIMLDVEADDPLFQVNWGV